MPRIGPLLWREIKQTAREAIESLQNEGLHACLFGSAACSFYGMQNRVPNDVDVVVMNADDFGYNPENIKYQLTCSNNRFFLVDSRDPHADYRILYFRLGGPDSRRRCKVDILVPGLLSIPNIPPDGFTYAANHPRIPLVPMMTLILLKLRGWWDHWNDDTRPWMREKAAQDEEDIEEMLSMAVHEGYSVWDGDREWWDEEFIKDALDWIEEYVENWPETEEDWRHLGFFDLVPTHHDHPSLEFALLSVGV
ncbi:hypothetical protein BKA70DRAFT_1564553 [Coprinopsis sp. MPI-PUGE-AT-0042]|nr:hypothetical protein BKA70DRAFT_1564553 [Coprinopsis sp. MPI-PUGE-AT-0042]